ncbi:methyl-accepting chemotaxis protein [Chitinimonas arctica]|uniref:Methyl-accepting chemotaxis protein n=1 Tax=Chitinimonas arctica TaxID=2594795 RepID=A0A516SJE6_9NEIS|nr:methyl-accepting chemotaxis protein [Chitinimonas arctica]QDQ28263.1 methyl-accepting chemotaxis protein [Chitinimonas arctica]
MAMLRSFLDRLMMWQKFIILAVLGVGLALPPIYLYFSHANTVIDISLNEQLGIGPGKTALNLLQQVQQHRGLSAAFLGASQLADKRQAKQEEVEKTLALLETQLKDQSGDLKEQLQKVRADWQGLSGGVATRSIDVPQSYQQHTALCVYLLKVVEQIADQFGLSLDPDADTYYLMRAVYVDLPTLAENLGQLRAKGAGLLATKQIDQNGKAVVYGLLSTARSGTERMENTLKKAVAANGDLQAKIGALVVEGSKNAREAAELARSKVAAVDTLDYPAPDYIAFFTQSIDVEFKLTHAAMQQLDDLIAARISHQRSTRNLLFAAIVSMASLAAVIGWLVAASILRPVRQALAAAQAVAAGDLTHAIETGGKSETGQMLNALALMQQSLQKTITSTRDHANELANAAEALATSSTQVSQASSQQSETTAAMAAVVEQLTVSISQVSDNTDDAGRASVNAGKLSQEGTLVIQQTATDIRDIAQSIRSTAKTISELGEQSKHISGIVAVIREVADQTNLLALNAAIEAARAGEYGRGFAVVADEVRKLAERTSGATKEIAQMIEQIRSHTTESVAGMNITVEKVGSVVASAEQARSAIERITKSAAVVEDAVGVINTALKEQTTASTQIASRVEQVAQMSEENTAAASATAASAQGLTVLATAMREEVKHFNV